MDTAFAGIAEVIDSPLYKAERCKFSVGANVAFQARQDLRQRLMAGNGEAVQVESPSYRKRLKLLLELAGNNGVPLMFYRPSFSRVKLHVWFVVLSLALCGMSVDGLRTTSAQQQERPRRVGPASPTSDMNSAAATGEEVDENDVVRVDTQLINVPVVVRDESGRPITGLTASSFQLYEDDCPQRVATFATLDAPFEVALLLDTSGSTREEINLIRGAAYAFIDSLRSGDRVAILSFDNAEDSSGKRRATIGVKSYLTDDRSALRGAIENIGGSNGTPYYDALQRVVQDVFRDQPRPEVRGRRAFVALTDGVDSSSVSDFASVRARLLEADLLAYFVQVDTEAYVEDRLLVDCQDDRTLRLSRIQLERYRRLFDPRADPDEYADFCRLGSFERMAVSRSLYQLARQEMGQLARDTGGKTFAVTDLSGARNAFAEVSSEIGRQYSLGYYSSNKSHDGRFRQIRVKVHEIPGAQVSAREGYETTKRVTARG